MPRRHIARAALVGMALTSAGVAGGAEYEYIFRPNAIVKPAAGLELVAPAPIRAYVGDTVATSLTAKGGGKSLTFSLVGGSLPAGVSLSPDGTVSGTAKSAGPSQARVRVSDETGASAEGSLASLVLIPTAGISGLPAMLRPGATASATLSTNMPGAGWRLGSVPGDLMLGRDGGTLSVTVPPLLSETTYEIDATAVGPAGATASVLARVQAMPLPSFSRQPTDASLTLGSPASIEVALDHAVPPVRFVLLMDGNPAPSALAACGLTFSEQTGTVGGVVGTPCSATGLSVMATDADGATSVSNPFSVSARSSIAVASQPTQANFNVTKGSSTPVSVAASGVPFGAARWTVRAPSGDVPAWISSAVAGCSGLSCSFSLTPTPDAAAGASQPYVVTLSDASGASVEFGSFTVTVAEAVVEVSNLAPSVAEGFASTLTAGAGALQGPTWSLVGAPAGVTVDSRGVVSVYGGSVSTATVLPAFRVKAAAGGFTALSAPVTATVTPATLGVGQPRAAHAGGTFLIEANAALPDGGTWTMTGAANPTFNAPTAAVVAQGTAQAVTGTAPVDQAVTLSYALDAAAVPAGVAPPSATANATVRVHPALAIVGSTPAVTATETSPITAILLSPATGSLIGTAEWTLSGQPSGLFISNTGVISGSPASGRAGSYLVTATLSDTGDTTPAGKATRTFAMTVQEAVTLSVASSLAVDTVQLPTTTGACTPLRVTNTGNGTATNLAVTIASGEFQSCVPTATPTCATVGSIGLNGSCNLGVRLASSTTTGAKTGSAQVTATGAPAKTVSLTSNTAAAAAVTANNVSPTDYFISSGGKSFNVAAPTYGLDGSMSGGYVVMIYEGDYVTANFAQRTTASCAYVAYDNGGTWSGNPFQIRYKDGSGSITGQSATFKPVGAGYVFNFGAEVTANKFDIVLAPTGYFQRLQHFRLGIMVGGNCQYR